MKRITCRRALIVDDEAGARNDLRELLTTHPQIEVVGEATNVAEAIDQFRSAKPDLIFLDVQMPHRDGFSLLPELQPVPDIIFVTAYDCFAIRAFEVNAVDYLLKPIEVERLAQALVRVKKKRRPSQFDEQDLMILNSGRRTCTVTTENISHIEADQNYSRVHMANREPFFIRRKMSEWMRILPSGLFYRPYRSLIVNRMAVKEIVPLPRKRAELVLIDGQVIRLGRGPARRLRCALRASA